MKACMVWGDLATHRAGEPLPTVPICLSCLTQEESSPDSQIITVVDYDPSLGDKCHYCNKPAPR